MFIPGACQDARSLENKGRIELSYKLKRRVRGDDLIFVGCDRAIAGTIRDAAAPSGQHRSFDNCGERTVAGAVVNQMGEE
jgi:hypothetical protein